MLPQCKLGFVLCGKTRFNVIKCFGRFLSLLKVTNKNSAIWMLSFFWVLCVLSWAMISYFLFFPPTFCHKITFFKPKRSYLVLLHHTWSICCMNDKKWTGWFYLPLKKKNLLHDGTDIFFSFTLFHLFLFLHIVMQKCQKMSYRKRNVCSSTQNHQQLVWWIFFFHFY